MFMKKDKSEYVDKKPDELPGLRKNHLFCPLRAEKYGLSILTEYINIPSSLSESCGKIQRYSAVRPLRDI